MKKNVFTFALTLLTATSAWAYDFKAGDLYYNITDESAKTVAVTYEYPWYESNNYSSLPGAVTIPETVSYNGINYSVTSIGDYAFWSCSALTQVTIGNSVTSIGEWAFADCSELAFVRCEATTPPTLESGCFGDTFLVFIPTGTKDAYTAAWGSSYTYVEGEGVELTVHVETPGGLTEAIMAEGYMPAAVNKLTVTGTLNETDFSIIKNNMTSLYDLDISGITNTTLPEAVFSGKTTLLQIDLPTQLTAIPDYAFQSCLITSITIPESVTSIGNGAFYGTALYNNVENWTNNVLYIDNCLIKAKEELSGSYEIATGTRLIGGGAFYGCSKLTQVNIPESVTSIGYGAFSGCSALTQITIPKSVESIGGDAFEGTALYNNADNWTNNVLYIDNCLIKAKEELSGSYEIATGTRVIAGSAFHNCSALTQITIPNSVTSIGDGAFYECSALTQVTIPGSVTSIGYYAFGYCSALTQVTIPGSVTSIGGSAFYNCSALTAVYYTGDVAGWCGISFNGYASNPLDYAHNLYIDNTLVTELVIPEGVTEIKDYAFYGCSATQVTIPGSVTSIGSSAFEGCSALTQITIGNSVTSIGSSAFRNCSTLTQVTIPESVTSIGSSAFEGCSALTQITIGNSVTSIGSSAFEGCQLSVYKNLSTTMVTPSILIHSPALDTLVCPAEELNVITDQELLSCSKQVKSIEVHSGTLTAAGFAYIKRQQNTLAILDMGTTENTELDNLALYDCYALEKLTLPAGLERIGYKAVAECVGLQAIDIPAGVTEIDDRAFENCRSISSISFGQESGQKSTRSTASSLKRIGNWAFYNCHQLQELAIPEGVTEIGNAAFYGCTYLENLELPASVQAIGDNCFALCSKLQAITVQATTPPMIAAKTFYDVNRDIPVYVPADALEAYQNDTYWQEFNLHAMPATGLQTPSMPESIRVYGGLLHNPQGLHLSLYDMQGRMVYSGTAATVSQPAGVYVLRCAGASGKVLF